MTSYNIWYLSDIQLPYYSLTIGDIKYNHPEKYNDKSEYDVLTGSIYIIYTARLAEGLSDGDATASDITTEERHYKVHAKTLAQIWSIVLSSLHQTLKTTAQVGLDTMSNHLSVGIRWI